MIYVYMYIQYTYERNYIHIYIYMYLYRAQDAILQPHSCAPFQIPIPEGPASPNIFVTCKTSLPCPTKLQAPISRRLLHTLASRQADSETRRLELPCDDSTSPIEPFVTCCQKARKQMPSLNSALTSLLNPYGLDAAQKTKGVKEYAGKPSLQNLKDVGLIVISPTVEARSLS